MGNLPMVRVPTHFSRRLNKQSRERREIELPRSRDCFFGCAEVHEYVHGMGGTPMLRRNQIHRFRLNRYSIPVTAPPITINAPQNPQRLCSPGIVSKFIPKNPVMT